jgi:hypothetical protein
MVTVKFCSQNLEKEAASAKQLPQVAANDKGDHGTDKVVNAKTQYAQLTTDKMRLKIKGVVNRAIQNVSDGDRSRTKHVDNDTLGSRIHLTAEGNALERLTVGATWELGVASNTSANVGMGKSSTDAAENPSGATSRDAFSNRIAEVFFQDKHLGKLSLGLGNMASKGSMEDTDLSKTTAASVGGSFASIAGGHYFYEAISQTRTLQVGILADKFNGLGIRNRIRYDSPSYKGLVVSASHSGSNNDRFDGSANFNVKVNDVQIAAAVSAQNNRAAGAFDPSYPLSNTYRQLNGSIGIAFHSGFNIYLGGGKRHYSESFRKPANMYAIKLGYFNKFFENIGVTAFAICYGRFNNAQRALQTGALNENYSVDSYGVHVVQNIEKVGIDVYFSYQRFMLSTHLINTNYKPINAIMMGAAVKF